MLLSDTTIPVALVPNSFHAKICPEGNMFLTVYVMILVCQIVLRQIHHLCHSKKLPDKRLPQDVSYLYRLCVLAMCFNQVGIWQRWSWSLTCYVHWLSIKFRPLWPYFSVVLATIHAHARAHTSTHIQLSFRVSSVKGSFNAEGTTAICAENAD